MNSLICCNTFYLSFCSEIYKYLLLNGNIVIQSLIKLFAFAVFVFDFERFIKKIPGVSCPLAILANVWLNVLETDSDLRVVFCGLLIHVRYTTGFVYVINLLFRCLCQSRSCSIPEKIFFSASSSAHSLSSTLIEAW